MNSQKQYWQRLRQIQRLLTGTIGLLKSKRGGFMQYGMQQVAEKEKAPELSGAFNMARMEGVEPPTAWFVARYSIQLSYMRTL